MSNNLKDAIEAAITEQTADVVAQLSVEQKAALESKFNALPDEVRSAIATRYPALSTVGMYIVRQAVREANGKMASQKRPQWFAKLELNAASLKSQEAAIKAYAEKQLRELAEEIDSKESTNLLKKYKNTHDLTSKDKHITELCGIFGVSASTLA